MAGKEVRKWADKAMFKADEIDVAKGPQVKLLSCNNDPLGTIAAAALMYEGKSVGSLAEITDAQRRYYLDQVQRSVLEAPLEFVNFHFIITGVTRGFTHQMVRQRTATYTQESTRFAVKETIPVGYPPSLINTMSWDDWQKACRQQLFPLVQQWSELTGAQAQMVLEYATTMAKKEQRWRRDWDNAILNLESVYNGFVSDGMPAEDARGLLPTNTLTRINYNTSMRGLKDHAGVRLCTQAQFEWRQVWVAMLNAIREYGKTQQYRYNFGPGIGDPPGGAGWKSSQWQFDALADVFKPICYYKGRCQFMSDVDRACSIRDRVEAFANLGIPSTLWGVPGTGHIGKDGFVIAPIADSEWMADPSAARVSE